MNEKINGIILTELKEEIRNAYQSDAEEKISKFDRFLESAPKDSDETFLRYLKLEITKSGIDDIIRRYYERIIITISPDNTNIATEGFYFYWNNYKDPTLDDKNIVASCYEYAIYCARFALSNDKDRKSILDTIFNNTEETEKFKNFIDSIRSEDKTFFAWHVIQYFSDEDYQCRKFDASTQVSQYQAKGLKNDQEDAFCVSILKDCAHLNNDVLKKIFIEAFKKSDDTYSTKKHIGSTAITALILPKSIFVSSVGDSRAYYLKVSPKGEIELIRLNRLHNINNPDERKRVEDALGYFKKGRLRSKTSSIAMTRAIGHKDHYIGISCEPTFSEQEILEDSLQFIILCSDGMTDTIDELDGNTENEKIEIDYIKSKIINLVEKNIDYNEWPEKLAREAFIDGSTDNITIMIKPIRQNEDPYMLLCLFDGHNGSHVSFGLRDNFPELLQMCINQYPKHNFLKELIESSHPIYSSKNIDKPIPEKPETNDDLESKDSFSQLSS